MNVIKFSACLISLGALGVLGACSTEPVNSAASVTTTAMSAGEQLSALAERYTDAGFALNPVGATRIGDERYYGLFVNNQTAEYRQRELTLQTETLAALKKIDARQLSEADRLNRDVLEYRLNMNIAGAQYDFHLMPLSQFYSLPLTLVQFASTEGAQPFRTVKHYEQFLQRMEGFPGWTDSAIGNMREGMSKQVVLPKVLVEKMLPQLKSQIVVDPTQSGFYVPVKKFPASFSDADRARLSEAYRKLVAEKITPAFTRLYTFIEKEYLPSARASTGYGSLPNGAAMYAYRAADSTTTTLTPEEIHQIGLREVARIRGEMEKVRVQVGFNGNLDAFLQSIAVNPNLTPFKSEAEVIAAYGALQQRITPLLGKAFSITPKSALVIRPEPEITRATAAAHYNVGTPDGSRPGVFYAPVRNAATYTTPKMTSLFLHEGVPGHHFQVSLAMESALPRFRRFSSFTAYSEGWGLYAESLGNELGVYDDPYQYMGRLLGEMHRAIRLVVDTGMHAKGWTREQAIDYSIANEGGRREDAVQEIERYMAIPGQALAYKIGELKIMEIRRRAEKKLGNKFDLREFHNQVLKDGGLPLTVLETKMNRWMDAQ